MNIIRKISYNCLLLILALQLLNMSFSNPANFFSQKSEHRISANNHINSALEYFTENVLGWSDFIPEQDNKTEHQTHHISKNSSANFFVVEQHTNLQYTPVLFPTIQYPMSVGISFIGFEKEITPPPPKA